MNDTRTIGLAATDCRYRSVHDHCCCIYAWGTFSIQNRVPKIVNDIVHAAFSVQAVGLADGRSQCKLSGLQTVVLSASCRACRRSFSVQAVGLADGRSQCKLSGLQTVVLSASCRACRRSFSVQAVGLADDLSPCKLSGLQTVALSASCRACRRSCSVQAGGLADGPAQCNLVGLQTIFLNATWRACRRYFAVCDSRVPTLGTWRIRCGLFPDTCYQHRCSGPNCRHRQLHIGRAMTHFLRVYLHGSKCWRCS